MLIFHPVILAVRRLVAFESHTGFNHFVLRHGSRDADELNEIGQLVNRNERNVSILITADAHRRAKSVRHGRLLRSVDVDRVEEDLAIFVVHNRLVKRQ